MLHVQRIVIVGTGLLGASIGLGLRKRGYGGDVLGVGRRQETLDAALARGAIDRGYLSLFDALTDGCLVVLATPLSCFPEAFDHIAEVSYPGLVITDAGSVKARVLDEARQRLRPSQAFVGSHPMAGGEEQGPAAATPDLFVGKPCAIVVPEYTAGAAVSLVESLWTTLGMTTLRLSAEAHDAAVATVSHVPHLAAALLVHLATQRGGWELASTGFHDATRLASGTPPMWRDIVEWNRDAVVDALRAASTELATLLARVDKGDDEALLQWLTSAKSARDQWLASHRSPA